MPRLHVVPVALVPTLNNGIDDQVQRVFLIAITSLMLTPFRLISSEVFMFDLVAFGLVAFWPIASRLSELGPITFTVMAAVVLYTLSVIATLIASVTNFCLMLFQLDRVGMWYVSGHHIVSIFLLRTIVYNILIPLLRTVTVTITATLISVLFDAFVFILLFHVFVTERDICDQTQVRSNEDTTQCTFQPVDQIQGLLVLKQDVVLDACLPKIAADFDQPPYYVHQLYRPPPFFPDGFEPPAHDLLHFAP